MPGRDRAMGDSDSSEIESALAAMDVDQLRAVVRETLRDMGLEDEQRPRRRLLNSIIEHAVRSASGRASGWTAAIPSDDDVAEVISFVVAAKREGYADPRDIDDRLQRGSNAFFAKDYASAALIFRALIPPISDVEIDLGQREMVDEVLDVDLAQCVAQHAVAMYMIASPDQRASAVRDALDEMCGVECCWEPLCQMERAAVESLPGFNEFLPRWRKLIEEETGSGRPTGGDTPQDCWLREVALKMHGADGLAEIARSSRRASDLDAWCRTLETSRDWKAALAAYDEAAAIVADGKVASHWRGKFLDGAALAAQELGRKDLPGRLERAWRQDPDMLRLRRWIGSSSSARVVRKRAAQALELCSKNATGQRAFLHVILGEYAAAAKLLSAAPGLGWSGEEHPGHLLVPVFCTLLRREFSGAFSDLTREAAAYTDRRMGPFTSTGADADVPRLSTPAPETIIQLVARDRSVTVEVRAAILRAMRNAAEKRIQGATEFKRRTVYDHAAQLVAACVALDETPAGGQWVANIRAEYSRFSALQRELDRHLSCR